MSIMNLCQGDLVVKQTLTTTVGASGGVQRSYTDGKKYDCLIQIPSAREVHDYNLRGQKLDYWVFFPRNIELDESNQLKWTVEAGQILAEPQYLRVLTYSKEGRPNGDMLWIAACEYVTSRDQP